MMKSEELKDFKISDKDGIKTATRPDLSISVESKDPKDSKIFHRRTVQPFVSGSDIVTSTLVCRLGDVYIYIGSSGNILVTKNNKLN